MTFFGFAPGSAGGALAGVFVGAPMEGVVFGGLTGIGAHTARRVLLASPKFTDWLVDAAFAKPANFTVHIVRLVEIAADQDSDTRAAIVDYIEAMEHLLASEEPAPEPAAQQGPFMGATLHDALGSIFGGQRRQLPGGR